MKKVKKQRQEEKKKLREETKISARTTVFSNLPDECIDQIFLSLPVNTILRCRCVSKDWNSRLRNPHFIKMHLNRVSEIDDTGSTIVIGTGSKLYKVDLDAFDKKPIEIDLPFNSTRPKSPIELAGSANGLLCLTLAYFYGHIVYLWNPATGECKQLPLPDHNNYDIRRDAGFALGFGYDRISGEFKVISERKTGPHKFEAIVFTLGTSSWRSIGELQYPLRYSKAQVFGGCPYWIMRDLKSIVSFSIGNEKFNKIPLPPINDPVMNLTSIGGRLSIFSRRRPIFNQRPCELWVKMDDGLETTWTKQLSFNLLDIPRDISRYSSEKPLGFNNGQVLLWGDGPGLFDPVTDEVKTLHLRGGRRTYYQVCPYIESLAKLAIEDVPLKTEGMCTRTHKMKLRITGSDQAYVRSGSGQCSSTVKA